MYTFSRIFFKKIVAQAAFHILLPKEANVINEICPKGCQLRKGNGQAAGLSLTFS